MRIQVWLTNRNLWNTTTTLFSTRASRGHGYENSRPLHDLEILARLQRYGAATAFIDFTKNPYTALWFAVNSAQGKDGKVFVLDYTDKAKFKSVDEAKFKHAKGEDGKISDYLNSPPSASSASAKQPLPSYWYWEARWIRERAIRQNGIFVFGPPTIGDADYRAVVIDKNAKEGNYARTR